MNSELMLAKSLTDWDRLRAMTDEDIDFSDCPEATPEMFANAIVKRNGVTVRKFSLPARDNIEDVLPAEIRLTGKDTDFFEYLIGGIAVDDTWEIDLIQLMRHPNVTFRAGYLNLVRGLCAVEPRWVAKHDMRFFVAEDHREALMRWILDRSNEESSTKRIPIMKSILLDCRLIIAFY
jgi:hypothetical protein